MVDQINALRAGPNSPIQSGDGLGAGFVAKIRAGGSDNDGYGWDQVVLDSSGEWATLPNGLSSDVCGVAYEMNGNNAVPEDAIVQMTVYVDASGAIGFRFIYAAATFSNFVARLTSSSGAAFAWTEQEETSAGVWGTLAGGRSGTVTVNAAYELNGRQGVPPTPLVVMYEQVSSTGSFFYWFVAPNSIFPVNLTIDGGSNGSLIAACTYTYTVKTLDTVTTLATGSSPVKPRSPLGSVVTSGTGIACYSATGTFLLMDAYEVIDTDACSGAP